MSTPENLTESASDAELLDAWLQSHDSDAIATLVDRYKPLVLGICLRQCRRRVDVEDAFQATFLQLSRNAGKIKNPAALPGWIHAVAYRIAVRTRQMYDYQSLDSVELPSEDLPLLQVARRHELQLLDEELNGLAEKERIPLVMHYLEGMTVGEIAGKTNETVGAVRGRLQRARVRLRGRLIRRGVSLSAALAACSLLPRGMINAAELTSRTVSLCCDLAGADGTATQNFSPDSDLSRLEHLLHSGGTSTMTVSTLTMGSMVTCLLLLFGIQPLTLGDPPGADSKVVLAGANGNDNDQTVAVQFPIAPPALPGQAGGLGGLQGPQKQVPLVTAKGDAKNQPEESKKVVVERSQAEQAILGKLAASTDRKIENLTLNELITYLQQSESLPAVLDAASLSTSRLETNVKLNASLPGTSLQGLLSAALQPHGLRAVVKDDLLKITVDADYEALAGGETTSWVSVDNEAANRLLATLEEATELTFEQVPLNDAVAAISEVHEIPILIDFRALDDIGLTTDLPVTVKTTGLSLRDTLELMLGENDLTISLRNNILMITTNEEAETEYRMLIRMYWLDGTGFAKAEDAITLIQSQVFPDRWDVMGGPATIGATASEESGRITLVITASLDVHLAAEKLLESFRKGQRKVRDSHATPESGVLRGYGGGMGGIGSGTGMGGGMM
jgi:RNA polymerase sigma factor (sigma-70 family)